MKHVYVAAVALASAAIVAGPIADQQKPTAPTTPVSPEIFAAQSRPGDAHARLAALTGSWTFTMRSELGPGGRRAEAGTLDIRPVMGGRFFVEEAKTRFMGQPFEWIGIHGYDTRQKRYVSSWIDNLSTQIDQMTGTWNEAARTLTYLGEDDHPGGGKTSIEWSIATGPSRIRIEMYEGAGATRRRVLEIAARRK